ncbi:MAG: twin-arginine translocation signal domain-containing protein [Bacteroidota bacterium]
MSKEISRRDFLKLSVRAGTAAFLSACGLGRTGAEPTPLVPTPTATEVPSATPTAEMGGEYWDTPYANPAPNEGSVFTLKNSDGAEVSVDLNQAVGFTPDADLRVSDISPNALDPVPSDAGNFQAYLNTVRDGFQPLAGYTDGTNDYNQYKDHQSGPQVPMYSWMVYTGLKAELPGIGRVEGGEGRAVMVLILNRTERVHRFPTNSVHVEAGFQGWGRIWNGESNYVQESEERLVNHYRTRLGQGVPETGFIGQCDLVDNCDSVTVVTAERMQWGNNPDGSPRDQFRLIRAETVPTAR